MNYKKEDAQIYFKDRWITYEEVKSMVGGFWYSTDLRFVNKQGKVYKELGNKEYKSIAFPFYCGSDMTKSYEEVFKNTKQLDEKYLYYIYDDYLDYLIQKIK